MITQDIIKTLHNGLIKCPLDVAGSVMPELKDIFDTCPLPHKNYFVDVKVHMLMPNQYPCIPNWHGDAIPRDADGNLLLEECDVDQKMFLWLSNPPITEFKDGRKIKIQEWNEFVQTDVHRGSISEDFIWRVFIRMMPASLTVRPREEKTCKRRHTQVYLNSEKFTW